MIQKKLISLFLYIGISACSTMWGSEQTAEIPQDFDTVLQSKTAYEDKCNYVNSILKTLDSQYEYRTNVMRKAINAGISPNDLTCDGTPLLTNAVLSSDGSLAELLLKHKADTVKVNYDTIYPPIIFQAPNKSIAKLLLDHNAPFHEFNQHQETLLFSRVRFKSGRLWSLMSVFFVQHGIPLYGKCLKDSDLTVVQWLKNEALLNDFHRDLLHKLKTAFFERRVAFKAALADSGLPVPVQRLALDYDDIQEFDESEK